MMQLNYPTNDNRKKQSEYKSNKLVLWILSYYSMERKTYMKVAFKKSFEANPTKLFMKVIKQKYIPCSKSTVIFTYQVQIETILSLGE